MLLRRTSALPQLFDRQKPLILEPLVGHAGLGSHCSSTSPRPLRQNDIPPAKDVHPVEWGTWRLGLVCPPQADSSAHRFALGVGRLLCSLFPAGKPVAKLLPFRRALAATAPATSSGSSTCRRLVFLSRLTTFQGSSRYAFHVASSNRP